VQLGFGWTNGVILDLLHLYSDRLQAVPGPFEAAPLQDGPQEVAPLEEVPIQNPAGPFHPRPPVSSASSALVASLVVTILLLVGVGLGGGYW